MDMYTSISLFCWYPLFVKFDLIYINKNVISNFYEKYHERIL